MTGSAIKTVIALALWKILLSLDWVRRACGVVKYPSHPISSEEGERQWSGAAPRGVAKWIEPGGGMHRVNSGGPM